MCRLIFALLFAYGINRFSHDVAQIEDIVPGRVKKCGHEVELRTYVVTDQLSVTFQCFRNGGGVFELGKYTRKLENWEKLRSMKSAIPVSKHLVKFEKF